MNVEQLIRVIIEEFPDALRSEIGDALMINDRHAGKLIVRAGGEGRVRKFAGKKDPAAVKKIEQFVRTVTGGEAEIVIARGNYPVLCVDGKVMA